MKKNIFFIFCLSFIISLIITPLRGGYVSIGEITGVKLSGLVALIIYYFLTLWLLFKYKDKIRPSWIILAILSGVSLLNLPIRIIHFTETLVSLPDYFLHTFPVLMAYLSSKIVMPVRWIILFMTFITGGWLAISGYDYWLHKLSFGSFTGKTAGIDASRFSFETLQGDTISVASFQGTYLILDCWSTYCGVCYMKFPQFQALYDKYKDHSDVTVFALHCRYEDNKNREDLHTGDSILKSRNYSFPCLSIESKNSYLVNNMGVTSYPQILIFDQTGQLIYKTNIEKAQQIIQKLVN